MPAPAIDGATLVFVEVKAGRRGADLGPEQPALAVGPQKRLRIRRAATAWMATRRNSPSFAEIRFDVVGVTFDDAGMNLTVDHIRDAF
jgi:Holliday junction resolvase-like predicted endonuclease